jgi:predicted nucleic acid-binding Zn ribbon protein
VKRSKPEAISELLPRVLGELGLDETADAVRLLEAWDAALGPELAPHVSCEGMRRGVVQAQVRDSAWMQRLQMEKPRILRALSERMGGDTELRDLRMFVGPVDSR